MSDDENREVFDRALDALRGEVAYLAAQFSWDPQLRLQYANQIADFAQQMENEVRSGARTWRSAATEANAVRNATMDMVRSRSSPVGRALAEQMKAQGKTLNELIAKKTLDLFGPSADFSRLTVAEQNAVYAEVVKSAGRSNPTVNARMRNLSRAGRGLIVLSLAVSAYNVYTAEDEVDALAEEAAVTGAGIAGGVAGGALAGLACGPGAPVCVSIGAFVGGAAAAFGVSLFW